ncbi:MAG: hypothetical protein AzoDbin1_04223 [Azoarcus sp.]|nr:hypothetical protein [Azoarcus sp.]
MQARGIGQVSGGGVVSVNEALARGLRHRIVSDIAAAERASAQLMRVAARTCSTPATRKGARRFFKEQTRIYSRLLLAQPEDLIAGRLGVWLCWHACEDGADARYERDEIGVVLHVIDLLSGAGRTLALPLRLRAHLFERTFQRLGTTEPSEVLVELGHAALWGVALGIVLSCVKTMPEGKTLTAQLPFLLPTPSGAVLGDTLTEWPYVCVNTYVGGRRPLTPAKERLRLAMQAEMEHLSLQALERMVSGYFVGLLGTQGSGGRIDALFRRSIEACFTLMRQVSSVLQQHSHSLLAKAAREDAIQRNELMWRWANLQHRVQCEEVVA